MNNNYKIAIILFVLLILTLLSMPSANADSLFNSRGSCLFKDHRARTVGDIVTIIVVETTSAKNEGSSKFSKKVNMKGGVTIEGFLDYLLPSPKFFDPIQPLKELDIDPEEKFDGAGETESQNEFKTHITATIMEILPNGNFVIEGRKNIKVNADKQDVTLRGVIRPEDITPSNTVLSSLIADAEIFYTGDGPVSRRSKPGILSKIFNWVF
jgi:flagellar L-ring protein precursor FlgH